MGTEKIEGMRAPADVHLNPCVGNLRADQIPKNLYRIFVTPQGKRQMQRFDHTLCLWTPFGVNVSNKAI